MAALCCLLCLSSVGGVWAVWAFAEDPPLSHTERASIDLSIFVWAPEQILPTTKPGQNYLDLLYAILYAKNVGLNTGKAAILRNCNASDPLLHCDENVQGGNMKHTYTTEPSKDLDFIIEYKSDSLLILYIYVEAEAEAGRENYTLITVFKTYLVKENGEWSAPEAEPGYAPVEFFPGTNILSVDLSKWTYGDVPGQQQ